MPFKTLSGILFHIISFLNTSRNGHITNTVLCALNFSHKAGLNVHYNNLWPRERNIRYKSVVLPYTQYQKTINKIWQSLVSGTTCCVYKIYTTTRARIQSDMDIWVVHQNMRNSVW